MGKFKEYLIEQSDFKTMKDNMVDLEPEEKKKAIEAGCVWHFGGTGKNYCAIWKTKDSNGKIWYCSNSHRAFDKKPTLEQAIKAFEFIKSTS